MNSPISLNFSNFYIHDINYNLTIEFLLTDQTGKTYNAILTEEKLSQILSKLPQDSDDEFKEAESNED